MAIRYSPGDATHPPQAEISAPYGEGAELITALDWLRGQAANRNSLRVAFQVSIENPDDWLAAHYRLTDMTPSDRERTGSPAGTEEFWIGTVTGYADLRDDLQRIAGRAAFGTAQRALLRLAITLQPELERYQDQILGIEAWSLAGRH